MKSRRVFFILLVIFIVAALLWAASRLWLIPSFQVANPTGQPASLDTIKTFTDILFGAITVICTLATLFISLSKKEDKKEEMNKSRESDKGIDPRRRRTMLNQIEEFWVKEILEKSLHGAALLDLGINEQPDALDYPWTVRREASREKLPEKKPMLEIFEEIGLGRSLLILGAPGAGKTTMLIVLARQLIERARKDENEPIPAVFNLSSWNIEQTLSEWLASELNAFYGIPEKVAQEWVASNKVLFLLDGLDEVNKDYQGKCTAAINTFRQEHGFAGIVVCSRSEDYAKLQPRLSFFGAIEIQPLKPNQIIAYFKRLGPQLEGIYQILQKDTTLSEMARSPLFLSVMTLAYRGTLAVDILVSDNLDIQRKYLFDTYIARMFERPGRAYKAPIERSDTIHWLAWLADKMLVYNQTSFIPERIQPTWLEKEKQRKIYQMILGAVIGICSGFIGLPFWLSIGNKFGPIFGWIAGLILALATSLFIGLTGFGIPQKIQIIDSVTLDWGEGRKRLLTNLINGGLFGFSISIMTLIGFFLTFFISEYGINGFTNLRLNIQIKDILLVFDGLRDFLLIYFVAGVIYGLITWLLKELNVQRLRQNMNWKPRILSYLKISSIFGLLFLLVIAPFYWLLSFRMQIWSTNAIIMVIIMGLILGMTIAGLYGGFALVQHFTLRFVFARNNFLPWNLVPFVDYCSNLIFLRRVGGGYFFIHRLLMEHFAQIAKGSQPDFAEAYFDRGLANSQLKDYHSALANFTKAIEFKPNYANAYLRRGNIYLTLEDYPAALADYTKVIQLDPKNATAYYNRSLILRRFKDYSAALDDYTRFSKLNRNSAPYGMRPAWEPKFLSKLKSFFRRDVPGIRSAPRSLRPAYYQPRPIPRIRPTYHPVGTRFRKSRQLGFPISYNMPRSFWASTVNSLNEVSKLIRRKPEDAENYVERGSLYIQLQDFPAAVADFSQAIQLQPKNIPAYKSRANAYALSGEYNAAISDYTNVIQLKPQDADAYYYRGLCHFSHEEYSLAISDFTEATQLESEDEIAFYYRGLCYFFLEDYAAAISDFNLVIQTQSISRLAKAYIIACSYALQGNIKEAITKIHQANSRDEEGNWKDLIS